MKIHLWEIKYRPKILGDYIFQNAKQQGIIEKFIEEQNIPHLLLNGHRGTGKTSLAYMLKSLLNIDESDFLVINGSDENGINVIRNKIKGFISTFSHGDFKVVFIDEADRLTPDAQQVMRHMMEEYADNARFILTCNYGRKIIPELKSRCFELLFKSIDKNSMLERLAVILKAEKIKASLDNLNKIVDMAYPDMRKAVQLLQNNSKNGILNEPNEIDPSMETYLEIVSLMEKNQYKKIRECISGLNNDEYEELYKFLYTFLEEIGKFSDETKWKRGIIIIADYLDRHIRQADPEITAFAMFLKLGEI